MPLKVGVSGPCGMGKRSIPFSSPDSFSTKRYGVQKVPIQIQDTTMRDTKSDFRKRIFSNFELKIWHAIRSALSCLGVQAGSKKNCNLNDISVDF